MQALKQVLCLIISPLLIASCHNEYPGEIQVLSVLQEDETPCVLLTDGQRMSISNIRKYRDGKLVEYQGCASEGFYTENLEDRGGYTSQGLLVKNLSLKLAKEQVVFFGDKYEIARRSGDSIFVKNTMENGYLVFVGSIPH